MYRNKFLKERIHLNNKLVKAGLKIKIQFRSKNRDHL